MVGKWVAVGSWWHDEIVAAGKLPLMLCFVSFVVTFAITRTITRLIRAGRGPFRNRVTSSGVHVHHAVPGIVLLVSGALLAVATDTLSWSVTAALLIGTGMSLVLDEFALILHLTDVYWSNEGRLSVDVVSVVAAALGLLLVGFSPSGLAQIGNVELAVRLGAVGVLLIHAVVEVICVLKGKYALAVVGVVVPLLAEIGAIRLARPDSAWARHRYGTRRAAAAAQRADSFDRRWKPLLRRWQHLVGGAPSRPGSAT